MKVTSEKDRSTPEERQGNSLLRKFRGMPWAAQYQLVEDTRVTDPGTAAVLEEIMNQEERRRRKKP